MSCQYVQLLDKNTFFTVYLEALERRNSAVEMDMFEKASPMKNEVCKNGIFLLTSYISRKKPRARGGPQCVPSPPIT
jgi:hypothetical protein